MPQSKDRTGLIIWVGIGVLVYWLFTKDSPYGKPPKSYQEYPPKTETGYLSFDYEDWLIGV